MSTIAEVLKYPKGSPVQDLHATVIRAYPQRAGEGQYGPWTVMDLELEDATGTMKATWWYNMVSEPEQIKGQRVVISATADDKGNLRGAAIEHHEYKGNTTIRVKINGDRLQFANASQAAVGTAPTNGASAATPGRLTLSEYLSAAGRAYHYATDVLGITEAQAAVAFANTAGIAASQGRIVIDTEPEPDAPF